MNKELNHSAFFELLRAGLWEKEARLSQFKDVDYAAVMRLAEVQSVVGLVTSGLEKVVDAKVPKEVVLQFVGSTLQIEQRNKALNFFVAQLIEKLRKADVYAVLVKGQGVAQCYERPLWRTSGDVDLLLDIINYGRARRYLEPIAQSVQDENPQTLHLGMTISSWEVELHGTLRSGMLNKMDMVVDEIQYNTLKNRNVRVWINGNTDVYLPSPDNDVLFVFSHILKHFYYGGIGLRQICDWCRILWTYRNSIDLVLLEQRLLEMGVMDEWKAFSHMAVNNLGMPREAVPFYDNAARWANKAMGICDLVLNAGNFGNNIDKTYQKKYPYIVHKTITFWRRTRDLYQLMKIFPIHSLQAWARMVIVNVMYVIKIYYSKH